MDIFQAILLGLVQGLTEFIPVSSSGHLELIRGLFDFNPENFHFFLEFINLGTLVALLIFFRKRIVKILRDVFREKNYKLALNLLITSIPAGLIGLLLGGFIEENPFFGSLYTVAIAMGLVGIIMVLIDRLPHLSKLENENNLTPGRALAIGLVQTLALIPGTSRSASTIITGRIVGLDSKSAAEYSFIASIPLMLGVCLKMFLSSSSLAYLGTNFWPLLLSNFIAFGAGLFALKFMLKYLEKPKSLQTFGKYRIIIALLTLGILLILA